MDRRYFNVNDFKDIKLNLNESKASLESAAYDSAGGKQKNYDVFLSHSTKDKVLIRQIKQYLEEENEISVYIDWDEDSGTNRDEIANVVREAMKISRNFLIVKTDNSDASSWVSWETGYFDNKNPDRIGVLLVENETFTHKDFEHQEYLKSYEILGPDDIVTFIKDGVRELIAIRRDNDFRAGRLIVSPTGLIAGGDGASHSTKFYGD
jgi:hypothetical protein